MEYAILALSLISGAIFRRWWGGWFQPNATLKRIIGFILPLVVCFLVIGNSYLAIAMSAIILFGWLMPHHGYGMGMGFDGNRKTLSCILVMLAQYGGLTVLAGVMWELIKVHSGGLYYAPMGCIIWLGYYLSWFVCRKFDIKQTSFADSPTCYGELFLGAILVGGIPLARLIAG